MHPALTIAQAHKPGSDANAVFVWVAVLIAVIMVGFIVLMLLKRRIFTEAAGAEHTGGLMEELRRMKDSGQMSQQEYDAARKAMAARFAQGKDTAASSPTAKRIQPTQPES